MNNWIVTNLQALLMGAVMAASTIYALKGIERYDGDDGERSTRYATNYAKRAAIVFGVGMLLAATVAYVPAGFRGVVMDAGTGVQQEERGEGLALTLPFWQRVHNVNVRTQVFEYESFVQTKDLQEVTLPIAINFSVVPGSAAELFQEVGHDYVETIITPAAFQASTEAAGAIEATAIAVSRAELADSILGILTPQLASHGIVVEFVAVKDAVFDGEFLASVKAKVIATQRAIESERLVVVAENEALQAIETATGLAQSIIITANARDAEQELLDMSATEYVWFTTWDGKLPATWLSGDSEGIIVDLP
jgi:regulator of protease activity HflC (stomatin/prohibitin superfamily)